MSGKEISDEELMSLFEAAKWAPSSYNNQPWRFIYAKRNTSSWDIFFDLLVEFNQSWAKNASALIVIISRKNFEYNEKPSITSSFDTGAAWENLALQGSLDGLVVHGIEGFDYDKAKKVLNIPDDYKVEAMAAIGFPANKNVLSEELQKREEKSLRKSLKEIVFESKFKTKE